MAADELEVVTSVTAVVVLGSIKDYCDDMLENARKSMTSMYHEFRQGLLTQDATGAYDLAGDHLDPQTNERLRRTLLSVILVNPIIRMAYAALEDGGFVGIYQNNTLVDNNYAYTFIQDENMVCSDGNVRNGPGGCRHYYLLDSDTYAVSTQLSKWHHYDPRIRTWYTRVTSLPESFAFSDIYSSFSYRELLITSAVEIHTPSSTMRGVVGYDYALSDISTFLADKAEKNLNVGDSSRKRIFTIEVNTRRLLAISTGIDLIGNDEEYVANASNIGDDLVSWAEDSLFSIGFPSNLEKPILSDQERQVYVSGTRDSSQMWYFALVLPVECPAGFGFDYSSSSCQRCIPPLTSSTNSATCDTCMKGHFMTMNDGSCEACPVGMECSNPGVALENATLLPGYWRQGATSTVVERCEMDGCLGGAATGETSCDVGYSGPLCAVCDTGYFENIGECRACDDIGGFKNWIPVICVFIFGILIVAIQRVYHVHVPNFKAKIKTLDNVMQASGTMPWIVGMEWPDLFIRVVTSITVLNNLPVRCLPFITDVHDAISLSITIPIVMCVLTVFCGLYLYQRRNASSRVFDDSIWVSLAFLYFMFPGVSMLLFRTYRSQHEDSRCHGLEDGTSFLRSDYSIECNGTRYDDTMSLILFGTLIFGVMVPLMFATILIYYRDRIQMYQDLGHAIYLARQSQERLALLYKHMLDHIQEQDDSMVVDNRSDMERANERVVFGEAKYRTELCAEVVARIQAGIHDSEGRYMRQEMLLSKALHAPMADLSSVSKRLKSESNRVKQQIVSKASERVTRLASVASDVTTSIAARSHQSKGDGENNASGPASQELAVGIWGGGDGGPGGDSTMTAEETKMGPPQTKLPNLRHSSVDHFRQNHARALERMKKLDHVEGFHTQFDSDADSEQDDARLQVARCHQTLLMQIMLMAELQEVVMMGPHRSEGLRSAKHLIDWKIRSTGSLAKYEFLFGDFRVWWWELFETSRRLLLTGFLCLFEQGSAFQLLFGICICLVTVYVTVLYQPAIQNIDNRVFSLSAFAILIVFIYATFLAASEGGWRGESGDAADADIYVAVLLVAILMTPAFLFVVLLRALLSLDWTLNTEAEIKTRLSDSVGGNQSGDAGHVDALSLTQDEE